MKLTNALRIIAICGLALVAASPSPAALAADAVEAPIERPAFMATPTNAALLYYRYWSMMNPEDEKAIATAVAELNEAEGESWVPTGELAEKLASNASYFNGVTKATKLPRADWGVEYDDGFLALIPHLGSVRRCARVFDADARRLLAAGEHAQAASRIAAIFRMADHASDGALLISSLVGVAVMDHGIKRVEAAVKNNQLDRDDARLILDAVRRFSGEDPFEFRKCIQAEAWVVTGDLEKNFRGPSAGKDFAAMMVDLQSFSDEGGNELRAKVEGLDEAQFRADLHRGVEYYRGVLAVWDLPDAKARLADLERRMKAGEFGVTTQIVSPAFDKARSKADTARERLATLTATLEAIAR